MRCGRLAACRRYCQRAPDVSDGRYGFVVSGSLPARATLLVHILNTCFFLFPASGFVSPRFVFRCIANHTTMYKSLSGSFPCVQRGMKKNWHDGSKRLNIFFSYKVADASFRCNPVEFLKPKTIYLRSNPQDIHIGKYKNDSFEDVSVREHFVGGCYEPYLSSAPRAFLFLFACFQAVNLLFLLPLSP